MKGKTLNILASVVMVSTLIASPVSADATTKTMKVHFINVGQGDATYIKMPSGEDVLIDGGGQGQGNEITAYLKKQKVDDIELNRCMLLKYCILLKHTKTFTSCKK